MKSETLVSPVLFAKVSPNPESNRWKVPEPPKSIVAFVPFPSVKNNSALLNTLEMTFRKNKYSPSVTFLCFIAKNVSKHKNDKHRNPQLTRQMVH